MKSMKSDLNFRKNAKLTGVPDIKAARESNTYDDGVLIGASKVNKNPKLETNKPNEIGALVSQDFDSENPVNKDSIELEVDS